MIQERFAISTSRLVMDYDTASDPQHACTAEHLLHVQTEHEH